MSETQAEVLDRILLELQNEDVTARLAALRDLGRLSYSSLAILRQLESLALQDPLPAVRQIALSVLDSSTHRYIRGTLTETPLSARTWIVSEIDAWQKDGLVSAGQAGVLRRRYDFDMAPSAPPAQAVAPVAEPPSPAPPPSTPAPAPPAAEPSPTLTQRFLSQSTVNILLYLGAFLVIGAALILAALVEAARLPILSGVAVVFAASAILLKKRLPQPSFALFIVFSFLLPILAGVIGESLDLKGAANDAYWSIVFLLTAAIWAGSTWFYNSRLFSLVSFISLALSVLRFVSIFTDSARWAATAAAFSIILGLAGVRLLRAWRDDKFARPLLITVQIAEPLLLMILLIAVPIQVLSSYAYSPGDWAAITLTWLFAAAFYLWSSQLYEFILLPWLAAAALLLAAWFLPNVFRAAEPGFTAIYAASALAMAMGSEALRRLGPAKTRTVSLPLLVASMIMFASAGVSGLLGDITHGFWALAGAALVYTALQVLRPHHFVWTTALLFGLAAYFSFFALPMFAHVEIPAGYLTLGASLLLMIPELFMRDPAGWRGSWRLPLIVIGVLAILVNALFQPFLKFADGDLPVSEMSFAAYATLALAYAVRFRRPVILYLATTSAAITVLSALSPIQGDAWLPIFTGLAVAYYAGGLALKVRENLRQWSEPLRISALALSILVIGAALITSTEAGAIYAVVVAALFFAELYLRPDDRLEPAAPLFLTIAAILAFPHPGGNDTVRLLLVISLLWYLSDVVYARTLKRRRFAVVTRLAAAGVVFANSVLLVFGLADASQATLCFAVYTAIAAFDAWFYRLPAMGYAAAAFLPLSVLFALRWAGQDNWLYAIVALAVVYYAVGYVLRRRGQSPPWSRVLLYSGLGLATLNSLSAPLQQGLQAAIPVAIAATLFAVEAFATSNVWLGFPANLLYLGAYFLILVWLKVDEPQFYSVGAALLGILMHYLLTRAGSTTGAFLTGMFSQLALLGTTYIQLFMTERLSFFIVIFLQALATLTYGIVIRSRSLLIAPIIFIVLSVITVIYGALKGISTVILIGCTGIVLLLLGILAVVLRERLVKFGDRWSSWRA